MRIPKVESLIYRSILFNFLPRLQTQKTQFNKFCTKNLQENDLQKVQKNNKNQFLKDQIPARKLSITFTCKVCNTRQVFL